MAVVGYGLGFSGLGQFELSLLKSTSHDAISHVSSSSIGSSTSCSSPVHMVTINSSLPLNVECSVTWDATLVYIRSADWNASLVSKKWYNIFLSLDDNEIVKKMWETNTGLLVQLSDGRVVTVSKNGETKASTVLNNMIHYCTLSDGNSYSLLSGGSVCSIDHNAIPTALFSGLKIQQMANGTDHVQLLTDGGCIYSFGVGTRGQLGLGDILSRAKPCLVEALAGIKVTSIKCGNWHTLCLTEYGDIYSWGLNDQHQLGHSDNEVFCLLPSIVTIASDKEIFTSINCGSRHSAALTNEHKLHIWGWNDYRQSGSDEVILNVNHVTCGPWNTVYFTSS